MNTKYLNQKNIHFKLKLTEYGKGVFTTLLNIQDGAAKCSILNV